MSKKHTFEDNQSIIFYALNLIGYRWQNIWSREEMESIALLAGWKAIEDYNAKQYNHALSTHVVNHVKWGLLNEYNRSDQAKVRAMGLHIGNVEFDNIDTKHTSQVIYDSESRRDNDELLSKLTVENERVNNQPVFDGQTTASELLMQRYNGRTLQDLGDEYGVSRERVRQIVAKAERRLEQAMRHTKRRYA
jgi:DNA-directed RNA polymerase specialized sigma24 family protein